ncbi:tail protein X [Neorhizobium sp. T786]|uniref:tail protein X n=1 Tax=Pseudorhizobium xiangyangii TaxID=2883104 RepID=UPI001CFFF0F9|nr:tail protein X [Neorhizobium xiangyangii]MCB5203950.1 tail protein X [Neorhizobium xiangyangii]
MTSYIVAFGGERLDRLARKVMQTERQGTVEAIMDANPDLASLSIEGWIPAGTVIHLPVAFNPAPAMSFTLAWE